MVEIINRSTALNLYGGHLHDVDIANLPYTSVCVNLNVDENNLNIDCVIDLATTVDCNLQ